MSHFTVLVVTNDDTDEALTAALQPFHEFECTGTDDQYVVEVDETDERRDEYAADTTRRLRAPDGSLHLPWADQFYRDPTPEEAPKVGMGTGFGGGLSYTSKDWGDGRGYRAKVEFVPEGYEEAEIPTRELMSFRDWVTDWTGKKVVRPGEQPDISNGEAHKYGYVLVDAAGEVVKIIERTNPNKKWDWWQVGGRWGGLLRVGGEHADSGKKSALDLAAMAEDSRRERREGVMKVYGEIQAKTGLDTNAITARWARFAALHTDLRAQWEASGKGVRLWDWMPEQSPEFKALQDEGISNIGFGWSSANVPTSELDPFAWCEKAPALSTFAFLTLDGQWCEKGEMGWWACVSGEKADWPEQHAALLAAVPDDCFVTVVDCHI